VFASAVIELVPHAHVRRTRNHSILAAARAMWVATTYSACRPAKSLMTFAVSVSPSPTLPRAQTRNTRSIAIFVRSARARSSYSGIERGPPLPLLPRSASLIAMRSLVKRGEELVTTRDVAGCTADAAAARPRQDTRAFLLLGATCNPIELEHFGVRGAFTSVAIADLVREGETVRLRRSAPAT
jgi:hypothetical protein